MTRLSVILFGTPQVEHDGAPVKLTQRKPLALLAYLGVTRTPHTREHLATLLWPEADQDRAFAYLRNALWQLNQTPVGAWIEADREHVTLRQETGFYLDVTHFEEQLAACKQHGHPPGNICPACVAPLTEAVNTYRGDFMTGLSLDDSVAYDEWQFFQTQSLRQAACDALEKLTRYHGQDSEEDAAQAIDYARQWLALDSQNESAHRELMRLYALAGQRSAALRQYEICMRTLKESLGVAPGEDTIKLYRQIRSGALASQVTPSRTTAITPATMAAPEPVQALAPRSALPTPTMPFVGRRKELAEVRRLLAQPDCHLLSVVGPGGVGKTRLALEAARLTAETPDHEFGDGIVMVTLTSVTTPEAASQEIAAALGLSPARQATEHLTFSRSATSTRIGAPVPADQALHDFLRDKRMLLVLDSLEHLLSHKPAKDKALTMVALVESLLQDAPGVTLLVTTRERLNLLMEWVLVLTGMTLPTADATTWVDSGAVRLFIQSAQRAMVGFGPTPEELASIAHICRLVEGFPLAIELAASWVRLLPCHEIAAEIVASFDFLSTSLRDVPQRHRSLRTIFEHSWTLLPPEEAEVLARLAIFRGGFTREAAREVAGASLLSLSTLMDKSLLQQVSTSTEPTSGRYEMHSMLRQYAEAKLRAYPGAFETTAERHAHTYLSLLARLEPDLKGGDQRRALDEIGKEWANVRAAWLWAVQHSAVHELQRAVFALHLFCNMKGHFEEATALFETALEVLEAASESPMSGNTVVEDRVHATPLPADGETDSARQALLGLLSILLAFHSSAMKPNVGKEAAARGLAILDAVGSRPERAFATLVALSQGTPVLKPEAERKLRETLAFYRARGDTVGCANAYQLLGILIADRSDDYVKGEEYLEEALRLHREAGDLAGAAYDLAQLGLVADSRSMSELAKQRHQEALALYCSLGDPRRSSLCWLRIGDLARRNGAMDEARSSLHEALRGAREVGDRLFTGQVLSYLWMIAYDEKAYAEARSYAEEEIAVWQQAGYTTHVADAQQRLADALLASGELAPARQYLEESLAVLPDNTWGWLGLGRVAEVEGNDDEARECYQRGIQIARNVDGLPAFSIVPAMLKGLIGISRLYVREGRTEKAVDILGLVLGQPLLHEAMRIEAETILSDFLGRDPSEVAEAARRHAGTADLYQVVDELIAS